MLFYGHTSCNAFSRGCKHCASSQLACFEDRTTVSSCTLVHRYLKCCVRQLQHHLQLLQPLARNVFYAPGTLTPEPRLSKNQELLTELPNDTCAIPEPLEIPVIPEIEDRNDSSATPPASVTVEKSEFTNLQQSANFAGADQADSHAGRDR